MDPLLFFPMAVLIALTPGPNNFCALNNGIRQGLGAALVATTGRVAAFAIFLTVSAIGLGAMLLASEVAFGAMRWIGAAYLFWLGIRAFRSSDYNGLAQDGLNGTSARPLKTLVIQEFLIGISNPKAVLLFAAIFPQFIDPGLPAARQFAVLGATYLLSEFVSSAVYGLGGLQLRRFITTSRGAARLNQATAGFFIGAGGLLLASHR